MKHKWYSKGKKGNWDHSATCTYSKVNTIKGVLEYWQSDVDVRSRASLDPGCHVWLGSFQSYAFHTCPACCLCSGELQMSGVRFTCRFCDLGFELLIRYIFGGPKASLLVSEGNKVTFFALWRPSLSWGAACCQVPLPQTATFPRFLPTISLLEVCGGPESQCVPSPILWRPCKTGSGSISGGRPKAESE